MTTATAHRVAGARPVEAGELAPLGDQHDGVGAGERIVGVGGDAHAGEVLVVGGRDRGVVGGDRRAFGAQPRRQHDRGRLAQIVGLGLEGEPEQRDVRVAQRPEALLELGDDAPLLQRVDLDHGVEQLEVVARVAGQLLERLHVLGKARTAVADAGVQEVRADAPVEAHARGHDAHVGADLLADVGDLVDERDLGRQEGVGGVLDHLGAGHGGAHDRGVDAGVERGDAVAVGIVVGADHDAVGVQHVVERGALAQELGVGRRSRCRQRPRRRARRSRTRPCPRARCSS